MKKVFVILAIFLLLLSSTGFAFDGSRKGFVLGGGLGLAPVAKWEGDPIPWFMTKYDESRVGLGLNLLIGYAWDEFNMIVYEGNMVAYQSDLLYNVDIIQGFNGAAWYHYFGPQGKTFFSTVGLGVYTFDLEWQYENVTVSGSNDPGIALMIGGGYEFARHFQAGLYVSTGKTTEPHYDYEHAHLSILVSAVAF